MAFNNERTELNSGDSSLRNPIPFQNEIWTSDKTANLYGVRAGADDSWKKYIGGDKTANLEIVDTPREIPFTNRVFDAFEQAVKEAKPLVVEFTQNNCGFCDKLNNETFRSDEMKKLGDKAVWVRLNIQKDEDDKGNVKQLMEDLKIDRAPTTVVLDCKANSLKEMGRIVGYFPGDKFAENLKQILPKETQAPVQLIADNASEKRNAA